VTTPLRRQYLDIKRRYPHAIVFFRLGDFYETFDSDAETVARELEITLTSRPVSKGERVPLAGIPHHALDSYLGKLIAKGYKVAICEQMEEPVKGKKIVDRQVVRVVTPGTLVEDNLLPSEGNNYLAAVLTQGDDEAAGLAFVDVSTGEFACLQADRPTVESELQRLGPAEVLAAGWTPLQGVARTITPVPGVDVGAAVDALLAHFGTSALDGLGLAGQRLAAAAAGLIIDYLRENQAAALGHVTRITCERPGGYMALDANTRRNLELFESLSQGPGRGPAGSGALTFLSMLDQTKTPMGGRLLRKWVGQPLLDVEKIHSRQDCVQFFFDSAVRRGQTQALLKRVPDMERLVARVSTAAAASPVSGTARDLVALRSGLEAIPPLREVIEGAGGVGPDLVTGLHPCNEVAELVRAAIDDDPQQDRVIRTGFSGELDVLRATARDARQVLAQIEQRERERTGIKSLKIGYNRVFGYYIEVSKANAELVPEDYQRKQTLVGGERYTMRELQEHEFRVLHAKEQLEELEAQLLRQVCVRVAADAARILETAAAVAFIDVYCSLGEAAAINGYVRPVVDDGDAIEVRDGRHPVVEGMLPDGSFVPNDVSLSCSDAQVIVLTGPNMAGKSTYLRQVALIVLMAQMGSFVPAASARVGIVDRLFSRVGALDDISSGRSTFMVEMLETAAILHGATARSLLIFDEIGRGTSTYDGMAIARAVVEFIHNRPDAAARSLFATHYHELVELASFLPRVRNCNVAVAEEGGRVVFLHRILPGGADKSYGVHVAQLAGLPRPNRAAAQEILEDLEAARQWRRRLRSGAASRVTQLVVLFSRSDELSREIAKLDVESMAPYRRSRGSTS
jgi:DNA mismatch repair protein MutS